MQITTRQALAVNLYQYIYKPNIYGRFDISSLVLATVNVVPGPVQTIPDWVAFDATYLAAVAAGLITVVVGPTGNSTTNAGTASANVQLPTVAGASQVVVTNTGSNTSFGASLAYVLLGNSSVTVTPETGALVQPGGSIILPLNGNTYLAAIGLQADDLLNISVI